VLREALENAVVHGNQEDPGKKVHIRCRCGPGNEISIVVTDQGKGFDFGKIVGNGFRELRAVREDQGLVKGSKLRANRLVVEGAPPLGERSESWECYESRSPKHFPSKGGRLKADSFSPGFQN
jgi:hypothetical protein